MMLLRTLGCRILLSWNGTVAIKWQASWVYRPKDTLSIQKDVSAIGAFIATALNYEIERIRHDLDLD